MWCVSPVPTAPLVRLEAVTPNRRSWVISSPEPRTGLVPKLQGNNCSVLLTVARRDAGVSRPVFNPLPGAGGTPSDPQDLRPSAPPSSNRSFWVIFPYEEEGSRVPECWHPGPIHPGHTSFEPRWMPAVTDALQSVKTEPLADGYHSDDDLSGRGARVLLSDGAGGTQRPRTRPWTCASGSPGRVSSCLARAHSPGNNRSASPKRRRRASARTSHASPGRRRPGSTMHGEQTNHRLILVRFSFCDCRRALSEPLLLGYLAQWRAPAPRVVRAFIQQRNLFALRPRPAAVVSSVPSDACEPLLLGYQQNCSWHHAWCPSDPYIQQRKSFAFA